VAVAGSAVNFACVMSRTVSSPASSMRIFGIVQ
jgi:hypothetical protein